MSAILLLGGATARAQSPTPPDTNPKKPHPKLAATPSGGAGKTPSTVSGTGTANAAGGTASGAGASAANASLGASPNAATNAAPSATANASAGSNAGASAGSNAGANAGSNAGANASANAGSNAGTNANANAGAGASTSGGANANAGAGPGAAAGASASTAPAAVSLQHAGGATWTQGLGLVQTGSAAPDDADGNVTGSAASGDAPGADKTPDAVSTNVPARPRASLTEIAVRGFGGIDKRGGDDNVHAVAGGAARVEIRHTHSLFAPWAELAGSNSFGSEVSVFDVALRGGADLHPARITWLGVGPFIGYRQIRVSETVTPTGFSIDGQPTRTLASTVQGVDAGLQVHLRTNDEIDSDGAASRPSADLLAYGFIQGAGGSDTSNEAIVGLLGSVGGAVRFYVGGDACLAGSDKCIPHQFRGLLALGGSF